MPKSASVDGINEVYVRKAFLRSKHGATPDAGLRALAAAEGLDLEGDALWIEVPAPGGAAASFNEMCPLCLLAFVELRRRCDAWLGAHAACGTILFAR